MAWFRSRVSAAFGLAFVLAVSGACGGNKPAPMVPTDKGAGESDGKGPAEVGKPAPDLSIQTVNGKGQITRESLSGKVAVVDFWATWCGPCKQSFPKLEELAKQNAGKVQVIGISVDDKSDGVADFAKSNGATFPIGWDDGHSIANRWKVDSMPTTYILDSSGTVRYIHAGYHDGEADAIAKELATLAAEPSSGKGKEVAAGGDKDKDKDKEKDKPAGESGGGTTAAAGGEGAGGEGGDAAAEPPPKKKGGKPGKGAGKKPGTAPKKPGKKPKG
jgi:cytochrome c biogenesis protein CcmG, thiol:disulfide interchange protein DsbE